MNILIIENEKPAADKLNILLKKTDESIKVSAIMETVEESVNWLQNNPSPDLILADIQLDDGLCFEIFETIKVDVPVIFTTAYDDYLLQAFRVNSVDYLLKPIEEEKLRKAIAKFKSIHFNSSRDAITRLLDGLNKQYKTRFLIRYGTHYKSVQANDICFFYILERSTFLKTFQGKDYSLDNSLDYFQKLVDPSKFFRINRDCLININSIGEIISYSSSRLKIKLTEKIQPPEEDQLIVSREKVNDFKKWIDN